MIKIHERAVEYIYANHDDAMKIYAEVWHQKLENVAKYFPKYFGYEGEWSTGGFDKGALQKMSEGLQLIGESKGPVDWKAAIDQQFCRRACNIRSSKTVICLTGRMKRSALHRGADRDQNTMARRRAIRNLLSREPPPLGSIYYPDSRP